MPNFINEFDVGAYSIPNHNQILGQILYKIEIAKTVHAAAPWAAEAALYTLRQGSEMDIKNLVINGNTEYYSASASLLFSYFNQSDTCKKRAWVLKIHNVLKLYSNEDLMRLYERCQKGTVRKCA